jgi:hypothetical protein
MSQERHIKYKEENYLDSETNSNSIKDNISNKDNSKEKFYKKSIDFFPKTMNIEELNKNEYKQRKFSNENHLLIKGFVPKLKPIEINIVPSKLRLNKKCFKDLQYNKNNKIELNSNKYFSSYPNTEDEESDEYFPNNDISIIIKKENNDKIKDKRKILQKVKNRNIPKVKTINNIAKKKKYDLELDYSSESDLDDNNEIKHYSVNENKNILGKGISNRDRDRFNSWSILDVLQKKYKLENEI